MTHAKGPTRVRQYVYFALKSDTTTSATMTAHLGIEPDRVGVRGASQSDPARPACHSWRVECRTAGRTVDDQLAEVLDRIRPVTDSIRRLIATGAVSATLQVVRDFAADDGEAEQHVPVVTDSGVVLHALPGQHQLLGWHITAADMAFLSSLPADLDIDEYG